MGKGVAPSRARLARVSLIPGASRGKRVAIPSWCRPQRSRPVASQYPATLVAVRLGEPVARCGIFAGTLEVGRSSGTQVGMTLTATEVRALPAVVDVVTAAEVLGIGRTVAYELVRTGHFPTPVLRVGRQIKIPTAYLVDLLGLSTDPRTEASGPRPTGQESGRR